MCLLFFVFFFCVFHHWDLKRAKHERYICIKTSHWCMRIESMANEKKISLKCMKCTDFVCLHSVDLTWWWKVTKRINMQCIYAYDTNEMNEYSKSRFGGRFFGFPISNSIFAYFFELIAAIMRSTRSSFKSTKSWRKQTKKCSLDKEKETSVERYIFQVNNVARTSSFHVRLWLNGQLAAFSIPVVHRSVAINVNNNN